MEPLRPAAGPVSGASRHRPPPRAAAPREATHRVSACGHGVGALAVVVGLLASGCSRDASDLSWGFVFEPPALQDRASFVRARILEGGCAGTSVLYEAEIATAGAAAAPAPPRLSAGTYGLDGRARDATCLWFAAGCTEVVLPDAAARRATVVLRGVGASPQCDAGRCADGLCSAGGRDGGGVDGGAPDAGPDCSTEVCNGRDDDCDGMVDEDTNGAPCGSDVGSCAAGATLCVVGTLSCTGEVVPQPEQCNGLDDNCDGVVDEGNPGGGASCGTDVGECRPGTEECLGGRIECVGVVLPVRERCNGLDDNCDGVVDEGFDLMTDRRNCGMCGNDCGAGRACMGGACGCTPGLVFDPASGTCRDLASDPQHCGTIGNRCASIERCVSGACVCRPGLSLAGGSCVDLMTDPNHCGSAGLRCPVLTPVCARGLCERNCAGGDTLCGRSCVSFSVDPTNCGGCGTACAVNQVCAMGNCRDYLPGTGCGTCPCVSACTGDFDTCELYGGAVICRKS